MEVDLEVYWRNLTPGVNEVIKDYTAKDTFLKPELMSYLYDIAHTQHFHQSNRDFNIKSYQNTQKAIAASFIFAADFLLDGKEKK